MDLLCYLCLVFVMLLRLFIAALWPPAGKGLTLLALLCDVKLCFVTFTCGILGQAWYMIVSIPDLCLLSYFHHALSHLSILRTAGNLYFKYENGVI